MCQCLPHYEHILCMRLYQVRAAAMRHAPIPHDVLFHMSSTLSQSVTQSKAA